MGVEMRLFPTFSFAKKKKKKKKVDKQNLRGVSKTRPWADDG